MKNLFKLTLLAGILGSSFLFTSCDDYYFNSVKGNGDAVTVYRDISGYESVELLGSFEVYISNDTSSEIRIQAESNLMPYIVTGTRNNTLILKSKDNMNLSNTLPIKIYISMNKIRSLDLPGSGIITTDDDFYSDELSLNLSGSGRMKLTIDAGDVDIDLPGSGFIDLITQANNVDCNVSGSGNIILTGDALESDIRISGSGTVITLNLPVDIANCNIIGSGDAYVQVNQLLDVTISGSGDVNYRGNPVIKSNITGSGRIIKI